jgi:hypothetical protein
MKRQSGNKTNDFNPLVDVFKTIEGSEKPKKQQRTLLLVNEPFERFQKICKDEGVKPAHVIDKWISAFLSTYQD